MKETQRAKVVVGLFVAAASGIFAFLVVSLGDVSLRPRIRGSALFDDVTGLVPGARVMVAGVPVGQVRELQVEDGRARVRFVLYTGHGLTEGARAAVRARSLLGEKYLAMVPAASTGPPLSEGFEVPADPVPPTIDDVLAKAIPAIDKIPFEALGKDLEQIDRFLQSALPKLEKLVDEVDTADLAAAARRLRELLEQEGPAIHRALASLNEIADAYRPGAKGTAADLRTAVGNLREASEVLAGIDEAALDKDVARMRAALERLPATLDRLDATLDMMKKLDPLLDKLKELDAGDIERVLQKEGVRIRFSETKESRDDAAPR